MARLDLRLLGGFQARLGAGPVLPLPAKAQALLAYLAIRPGHAHPRDKLAALLWGDTGDAQARDSLRHAVAVLRKAIDAATTGGLIAEGQTYALDPAVAQIDAVRFERGVADGTPEALETAAALYQGDLLEGLAVGEARFEEWLLVERERFRELAVEGLAKLLAHHTQAGATETEHAIQTATRLLALDPLQEVVHRALMRLYARQGRRGAALKQYQFCVSVLQRELGAEPESDTKQLYQQILRERPAMAALSIAATAVTGDPAAAEMRVPASPAGRPPASSERAVPQPRVMSPEDEVLVGRDGELGTLRQALDDSINGRGRMVMVVGESGIGKTSVLRALAVEAAQRGARVLVGRSYESEQILPFAPWVDAFRTGLDLGGDDTVRAVSPIWRSELARLFPEVAVPDLPPPSEDQRRLFESVAHLVEQLARAQPLALLLEDLHWADEMSVRLLSFLGRRIPSSPALVIATARSEELVDATLLRRTLDELTRASHYAELSLGPLSRDDTARLTRFLSRASDDVEAVARLEQRIWRVSEGNPFVIVETLRALGDVSAALASPASSSVADSVRGMILSRLERLGDPARGVAAVAAIIGREFDFALLARAAELPEHDIAEALEELVRRRVLNAVGERFEFTHDRIREVVSSQLLPARRKLLHGAVARTLEALHAENLEPHYTALAFHYGEGKVWPKTVEYSRRAGVQAMEHGAYHESAASFDRALAALEHLDDDTDAARAALELRLRLRNALLPIGDQARMLDNLRKSEALAERLGDRSRLGWILSYSALELWRSGEAERAIDLAQRVLTISQALDDAGLRIIAGIRLGQAYHSVGRYVEAIDVLRTTVSELQGDRRLEHYGLSAPPSVIAPIWLGWCLAERGDFAEARRHADHALAIAEELSQPYPLVAACFGLGLVEVRQGNLEGAIGILERGIALCQSRQIPVFFSWTASLLAMASAAAGKTDRCASVLEPATELEISRKAARQAFPVLWLGEAHLLAGRLDQAGTHGRAALELAVSRRDRVHEAYAIHLLAEVAARRDQVDAETLYRKARALAHELGMQPLRARCEAALDRLQVK